MPSKSLLRSAVFAIASICVVLPSLAQADGPYAVTTGSYRYAGRDEPLVATDRKVDLWAEIYRPTTLSEKPFPVAVFLHGNHATCGKYNLDLQVREDIGAAYTDTGQCEPGEVVVPNHLGYEYLAKELASWGYIVVSINANRGITAGWGVEGDFGLNLMRGRLILRHLALLSDWNRGVGKIQAPASLKFDPRATMDLSQVGLMGHSRGGEGARAALQQFRDAGSPFQPLIAGLSIRSIFEIGPVDGQTDRVLDADGVDSMILLPSCDGDVFDLQGIRVFDRVFRRTTPDTSKTFHGTVYVWGANHNAYNTEWQQSDSPGCTGGGAIFQRNGLSKPQQLTAIGTLVPFFRATVGAKADRSLAAQFDPSASLPAMVTDITNVDRGYLPAPVGETVQKLETFSQPSGIGDEGVATTAKNVQVVHKAASFEHDEAVRVANVSWTQEPKQAFVQQHFQVNFKKPKNFAAFKTLSFRTALRCFSTICDFPASADGELSYGIQLVDTTGRVSGPYLTKQNVRISRPVGFGAPVTPAGPREAHWILHPTLYTVQVPLSALNSADLGRIKAVRFTFNGRQAGNVDIADLMLLKTEPAAPSASPQVASRSPTAAMAEARVQEAGVQLARVQFASMTPPTPSADGNTLTIVRKPAAAARQGGVSTQSLSPAKSSSPAKSATTVDIVLTSKRPFPVTNAFPRLKVGDKTVQGGAIGRDGKTMTISVPEATFDAFQAGADVSLSLLASSPVWEFGPLSK